jgi:NAD(P)-dependent dehydrogenase (short-subunit alcohol dehydrogenase family)
MVVSDIVARGGKAVLSTTDVTCGEEIVQLALKTFGSCDIIINNAGILRDKSFAKIRPDIEWRKVLDVHLEGTFSLCHAAWPVMLEQKYGRIVNIGSGAGLYGNFGQASYSAAKMAVLGLTQTLAIEGVRNTYLYFILSSLLYIFFQWRLLSGKT